MADAAGAADRRGPSSSSMNTLLTNEQQLETMTQRLGAEDAALLMHYITEKIPPCQETGMRITALPWCSLW